MSVGRPALVGLTLVLTCLAGLALVSPAPRPPTPSRLRSGPCRTRASTPPRLAVLVVFDQLRGDYLSRWERLFENGGFRRLMSKGAWFQNCHYPYAGTWTAAGHATLATGC